MQDTRSKLLVLEGVRQYSPFIFVFPQTFGSPPSIDCWSFQCRVSSGPASLQTHTQTLCLRLYSVFLSRILRKCLTQNKAAWTKRDRQSRARNQLQPPVYGAPKGFAADSQHLILIDQQIVSSGLLRRDKCNSESVKMACSCKIFYCRIVSSSSMYAFMHPLRGFCRRIALCSSSNGQKLEHRWQKAWLIHL